MNPHLGFSILTIFPSFLIYKSRLLAVDSPSCYENQSTSLIFKSYSINSSSFSQYPLPVRKANQPASTVMTSLQPTPGETRHKPWPSKSPWSEYKQHSLAFSRPAFGSVTETVNKSVNFKGWASVHRNWAEVTDLSSPVLPTTVIVTTLSQWPTARATPGGKRCVPPF